MNAAPVLSCATAVPCPAGWQAEAVLGRGRCSTVFLARRRGGPGVALKVARRAPAVAGALGLRAQFELLGALAHPRVVRACEHGIAGEQEFLAMEHAAGGPLVLRGALPAPQAGQILRQAAQALAWVHEQGWVHRDLKPANLLRRADGGLVLGDFGCARRRGSRDQPAGFAVVGSAQYAAPEQCQGAAADPRADVYSLGVLLYEMLAGQPPFPGPGVAEMLAQHLLAPVPGLPRACAAWQPLLDAMLAKDPQRRPPDGRAVLAALSTLAGAPPSRNPS